MVAAEEEEGEEEGGGGGDEAAVFAAAAVDATGAALLVAAATAIMSTRHSLDYASLESNNKFVAVNGECMRRTRLSSIQMEEPPLATRLLQVDLRAS